MIATTDQPRDVEQIRTPDQRLRVFISSTLGEMAVDRRSAREAVEQLRLTPVMFELGARPHPPRSLYRSYLAQSDVFVGLYWQRYGWVAPDMDISGLEEELVLSTGMPRLLYVKEPAPDIEPRLVEMLASVEADGTACYRRFSDPEELRTLLVDDLALLMTERFAARAEPEPAVPVPQIPVPASTFFGRGSELATLDALLGDSSRRLITLTGPGGTGKTRLALEAARRQAGRFNDGAVFVDLSRERDSDGVFTAIERAAGLDATPEASPFAAILRGLGDRHLLLILDNFEHVLEAAAAVAEMLARCPNVTVLATTREALRIGGELVIAVPPLSLPASRADSLLAAVMASEAGQLFAERAAASGSGFVLDDRNASDVASVIRRLDGLPLALELAAARTKLFGVADLRAQLDARHEVLTGGARDLPTRQQTLRKTIEWSCDLLTTDERTAFTVFSVFTDARLAHVEHALRAVTGLAGLDVVGAMSSLVDKSLVTVLEGADRTPRLSMLHTIREYAEELLDARPDMAASVRRAHAATYTQVAVDLSQGAGDGDRDVVVATLGSDLANVRSAWDHWVATRDVDRLHELVEPLWGYYDAQGDYRNATVLGDDLQRILASLPDTPERRSEQFAVQTNLARTILAVRGFTADAESAMREALDRFAAVGNTRQQFPALRSLASIHLMRSEFEEMSDVSDDLMAIADDEDDPALLSEAHLVAGVRSGWTQDLPAAVAHTDQAVVSHGEAQSGPVEFRVGPNPGVVANAVSALFRWMAGFPDGALERMRDALVLARQLQHPPSIGFALHHANLLDFWRNDAQSIRARSDELRVLADDHDYPTWRALSLIFHGVALVIEGEHDDGLDEVESGFALYSELSTPPIFWPALLTIRAQVFGAAGRTEPALVFIDEAETTSTPADPVAAHIAMTRGDLLLAKPTPDPAGAIAAFDRAVELATLGTARMAELEARTRLALACRGSDRAQGELERLRAVYDTFTEGSDCAPLVAAHTVLQAEPLPQHDLELAVGRT